MADQSAEDKQRESDARITDDASTRMRDTARWIVVGVVATAGGVITGTTFSNAGQLPAVGEDAWRLWTGVAGLAAGFAGLALLGADALRVMALDIYSPRELADAGRKRFGWRANVWRFLGGDHRFDEQTNIDLAAVRTRLERAERHNWPPEITSYAGLLDLALAADKMKAETPIEADFVTIFADKDVLKVRARGAKTLAFGGDKPVELRLAEGGLVAANRPATIAYDVADGAVRVHAGGAHTVERGELESLDLAAYRIAGFLKVEVAFEKLATRLYRNILLIAAGFIVTAWAFNPPAAAGDPRPAWEITTQLPGGETTVTRKSP